MGDGPSTFQPFPDGWSNIVISLSLLLTADDVDGLLFFFDDRGGRLLLRGNGKCHVTNKMFLKELRMGTLYCMHLCSQNIGLRPF